MCYICYGLATTYLRGSGAYLLTYLPDHLLALATSAGPENLEGTVLRQATATMGTEAKLSFLSADVVKLTTEVTKLTTEVDTFKSEIDTFYLMWAGARVVAVLAPPLSYHWKGTWC